MRVILLLFMHGTVTYLSLCTASDGWTPVCINFSFPCLYRLSTVVRQDGFSSRCICLCNALFCAAALYDPSISPDCAVATSTFHTFHSYEVYVL